MHQPALAQPAFDKAAEGLGAFKPAAQARGQGAADFFQARVHVVGGHDQLVRPCTHFAAHPFKARTARFQICHADHVVIRHGGGDVARGGTGQRPLLGVAAVLRIQVAQRLHVAQVVGGVSGVLEFKLAAHAGRQHGLRTGGEVALDGVQQGLRFRAGGAFRYVGHGARQVDGGGLGGRLMRRVETQREGAQAGVHAQAGAAHGRFEIFAREGQGAAAGHRAEQAGADDAAGAVGLGLQVEAQEAAGGGAAGF
ncbi:hypothetical protein D3C72_1475990 [compost metagenome]